ncbi:MAG: flagellar hook associated protein [Bdellovibrio sp.]|nr:MAG: flagellar hook associated protein [Bdellovibrio sp.]
MGPVRITGMASGLPPNIVDQLMDAERIPLKQMQEKKTDEEGRLKLVEDLETKVQSITKNLDELLGTRGFFNNKLISGDPNIIDGVVDPEKATTGEWQIEVVRLAQKPGAVSNAFADKDKTQIGTGYLRFDTPNGRKDVYINSRNNTLEGVAQAINSANIGVRGQVIMDKKDRENPYKLLVTGLATGDDNQVQFPTIYMLDGDRDVYFDESREAQNAIIKVDGFEMELTENQAKDIIPGVNLDFKQAAPGRPVRVKVKEDIEAVSGKIKNFVDAYNGVLGFIQNQHKLTKDKNGNERMGPMGGDGMLRSLESTLRRVILNPQLGVESSIQRMNELGIEFNRQGTLQFNPDKFQKVLSGSPFDVANFFRGDRLKTGFVPTVKRDVGDILSSQYGPIAIRKKGISDKIHNFDQRIEMKEKQLEKKEEQLRQKFADLESKMSQINSQGAQVNAMSAGMMAKG